MPYTMHRHENHASLRSCPLPKKQRRKKKKKTPDLRSKPCQIGFLFTHELGTISVTERRCAALISKGERHISDRYSHYTRSPRERQSDYPVWCENSGCKPSLIWISPKNFTCPSGKLRTNISSPIAKSTSPRRSDSTFFARWNILILAC